MSRKVKLRVPVELVVRDRDVRVVVVICNHSSRPGKPVVISLKTIADEIEASPDTTRRALKSCVEEGFLTVQANCLDNGGQIENSYSVTNRGVAVVAAAREAGVI